MNQRRLPQEMFRDCKPPLTKIRALVNGGYDRVEIAEFLCVGRRHAVVQAGQSARDC